MGLTCISMVCVDTGTSGTAGTSGAAGTGGTSGGVGGAVGAGGRGGAGGTAGAAGASGAVGSGGAAGGVGGTGGAQPDCYNGLTSTGNFVGAVAGSEGVAQGGVVADGIYDLTSATYGGPTQPGGTGRSITIRVTGSVMDFVVANTTDPTPSYRSYTFTMQGMTPPSVPVLIRTPTCPVSSATVTNGYTATASSLQLMYTNIGNGTWNQVDTYTKR